MQQSDIIGAQTRGAIIKIILLLAMPAVVDNFFQTILGFVDTLFVSKIGLVEVSAVGVSNAILAVYFAVFMSLGVAANVLIAKQIGRGDPDRAGIFAQQSIVLAALLGLLFGVISLFFSEALLHLMGVEENVLDAAVGYFNIVAIPSVFISLMFTLSSILRGIGDTQSPMKVSIVVNLLNIALDALLIFGFGFIPALGLKGAAYATLVSRMVGAAGLFWFYLKTDALKVLWKYWKPAGAFQNLLIRIGTPAMMERLVMRLGQVLYFGMIVSMGTHTFAAHSIAANIDIFSYMIGMGFAAAATTLVGQSLGAGKLDLARKYTRYSMILSGGCMLVVGLFLYTFGTWIGGFFTQDPQVIAQIGIALMVGALFKPVVAMVFVLTAVHQAAENTRFPMWVTAVGIWGVRTILVYYLGIQLGWGILGVNIAIGLDNIFRAAVLMVSYLTSGWLRVARSSLSPETR